jgi:hypothetical protein
MALQQDGLACKAAGSIGRTPFIVSIDDSTLDTIWSAYDEAARSRARSPAQYMGTRLLRDDSGALWNSTQNSSAYWASTPLTLKDFTDIN